MRYKLAYLMSRYPHLPETFILREMEELKKQGWEIALYPLIHQKKAAFHKEDDYWITQTRSIPFISSSVVKDNILIFSHDPYKYRHVFKEVVRRNVISPKFLIRALVLFPKAIHTAQAMVNEQVHHIHAHYATHPALVAWIIHALTNISYSVTVHAHDIFVDTTMLAQKLHEATFIVAISDFNRNLLINKLGDWINNKTHIIHCGVELANYSPRSRPVKPKDRLEVINIGSLQPYKGHKYLIDACELLYKRGIPYHCRIIGTGEEKNALVKRIKKAKMENYIKLLGKKTQEEIAQLLPSATCYVQPSIITPNGKMEGIPVSLMEALACQVPVIATNISGIQELVQPAKTGYLVPPNDPTALADTMEEVYNFPERANLTAQNGRELVAREYNLKTNVAKLSSLFENIYDSNFFKHKII